MKATTTGIFKGSIDIGTQDGKSKTCWCEKHEDAGPFVNKYFEVDKNKYSEVNKNATKIQPPVPNVEPQNESTFPTADIGNGRTPVTSSSNAEPNSTYGAAVQGLKSKPKKIKDILRVNEIEIFSERNVNYGLLAGILSLTNQRIIYFSKFPFKLIEIPLNSIRHINGGLLQPVRITTYDGQLYEFIVVKSTAWPNKIQSLVASNIPPNFGQ
jgi:hypothetical protein